MSTAPPPPGPITEAPRDRRLQLAVVALGCDALLMALVGPRPPLSGISLLWLFQAATDPATVGLHAAAALTLIAMLLSKRAPSLHSPSVVLQLVLLLFLGPAGTLMGLAAIVLDMLAPAAWAKGVLPTSTPPSGLIELRRRTAGQDDAQSQSLSDIFRYGSLAQRRRAVALIAGNFKPQFAPALQMALVDEHNAIRVQAGLALVQLEDEFGQRQRSLEGHSHAVASGNDAEAERIHLELARLHDQVAYSGILDPERTRQAQVRALQAYQQHLERVPNDTEAIAAVGRLFVRAGQPQLVADWFVQMMRKGDVHDAVVAWLAEALFCSGRYAELTDLLQQQWPRLDNYLPPDAPLRETLALWHQHATAARQGGDRVQRP